MSIPYYKREKAIKEVFEYEEKNNIPKNERVTRDAYADYPEINHVAPIKKTNVDIRLVMSIADGIRKLGKK